MIVTSFFCLCIIFSVLHFLDVVLELTILIVEEVSRSTLLNHSFLAHYKYAITIHDRLESMSYRDHRTILEFLSNQFLNLLLRDDVYARSSFIE